MKAKSKTPENILLMMLLGLVLIFPVVAEAGKNHHRYGHTSYHNGYGHSHHRHHTKKHKHKYKHHHGGYTRTYAPPQGYAYNQPYYPPQPSGYVSNYNVYPVVPAPAPVYGYPANRMIGISTGNGSFMLRY